MPKSFSLALALLIVLSSMLVACGSNTPAATPQPLPAQPQATQPPMKETVVIKETVQVPVEKTVIVQPTAAPTATPTVTPTVASVAPVVAPKAQPTQAGKLEFTIEFAPSAPRKGDNKVQLTLILHIQGGSKPFQVLEDTIPQTITATQDGVKYTQNWHNCGPDEPHTITVVSADGQKSSQSTMMAYRCE